MQELSLDVNGIRYRVAVHVERRRTTRASLGKAGVTIRLPSGLGAAERDRHLQRLMGWARSRLERLPVRRYQDGQVLPAAGRRYVLRIATPSGSRSSVRIRGDEIILRMCGGLSGPELSLAIGTRLSRALAREHRSWIEARVAELNRLHFRVPVRAISLRNSASTWGSCSPSGSLSFATRLLLAPQEIVDYVCIHELAHRLVPNHSASFWNLVRRALPEWEERRRWLRRHGHEISW
jgi:predicted metal-dependent hydrolase